MPGMSVRALVLRAPGTNCDDETAFAFERAGAEAEKVHVSALLAAPKRLLEFQILAIPGGFSYGDDLGAGKVLALQIREALLPWIRDFVRAGNLVIGICNGFQVLVKCGLLPFGVDAQAEPAATLGWNDSRKLESRWVRLSPGDSPSPFLSGLPPIELPVAHGEGRFIPRDAAVLDAIRRNRQVAFRYASRAGGRPAYPENPNGSADDIAGITDPTGRILGMMPHPERHVLPWQHPRWTREGAKEEGEGLAIFRNAVRHLEGAANRAPTAAPTA